jgi:hypothetical protein
MIRTSTPLKKSLKPKRCRHCGNSFAPISSMSKACSVPCALALNDAAKAKTAAKALKAERKSMKERAEKIKTRSEHLAELQDAVNAYVRLRDINDPCISCDKPATWRGQWHASHFKSVGHAPGLRFNLLNIHKACSVCNKWKSGNYAGYKPRLEKKIGKEMVDWLEGPAGNEPLKITVAEIKELKKFYRAEVRRLKKEVTLEMEEA